MAIELTGKLALKAGIEDTLIDDKELIKMKIPVPKTDTTARDAILEADRTENMEVKTADGKVYKLVGGTENTNWEEVVTGVDEEQLNTAVTSAISTEVPTIVNTAITGAGLAKQVDVNNLHNVVDKIGIQEMPIYSLFDAGTNDSYWLNYRVQCIEDHGKYLFTAGTNGITKWDMSVEYAPQRIGNLRPWSIANPSVTRDTYMLKMYNGYLYACLRAGAGAFTTAQTASTDTEADGAVGYVYIIDPETFELVTEIRYIYQGDVQGDITYTPTTDDGVTHIACTRNAKPTGIFIDEESSLLWVSFQLFGYAIYDISTPTSPVVVYDHYVDPTLTSTIKEEYQQGCFFRISDVLYSAVAGYEDGIHIFNLATPSAPVEVINDVTYNVAYHANATTTYTHVFAVAANYPYLYCTLAPNSPHANDEDRTTGLLVLDITNLNSIKDSIVPIPEKDWNTYISGQGGDIRPSEVVFAYDKIFMNNANKGTAVWAISDDPSAPKYLGCIPMKYGETKAIHCTKDGRFFQGSHVNPHYVQMTRVSSMQFDALGVIDSKVTTMSTLLNGLKEKTGEYVAVETEVIEGAYNTSGQLKTVADASYYSTYRAALLDCNSNEEYTFSGRVKGTSIAMVIFLKADTTVLSILNQGTNSEVYYTDEPFIVPFGAAKMAINSTNSINPVLKKLTTIDIKNKFTLLERNSIDNYWSGKKIVWFGTSIPAGSNGNGGAYPAIVSEKLGFTLYNESLGGSPVAVKSTGAYPYDLYSFAQTVAEKNAILSDWANQKINWSSAPDTIPTADSDKIIASSYENKLVEKYLGDDTKRCDLYVFDHGRNDATTNTEIPVDPYDRTTFIGGINYLVNLILTDNPHAKICFIGHYEKGRLPNISQAQTTIAEYWDFPLLKLWEKLGWSQREVTTTGYWENGLWVPSGGEPQTLTMTQLWMADNLHPASDNSGKAVGKIAGFVESFIRGIR